MRLQFSYCFLTVLVFLGIYAGFQVLCLVAFIACVLKKPDLDEDGDCTNELNNAISKHEEEVYAKGSSVIDGIELGNICISFSSHDIYNLINLFIFSSFTFLVHTDWYLAYLNSFE